MPVNYYAILGVAANASVEEIRRAYRKSALAVHPDRGGSDRLMQRINEAWDVLGDAKKRREYDAQLAAAAAGPRPASRTGARPGKPAGRGRAGPPPPTLASIAGSLFGRALHAIGGWMEPGPKPRGKAAPNGGIVIVRCRRCGQKLRVRQGVSMRIRCPKCRHLETLD